MKNFLFLVLSFFVSSFAFSQEISTPIILQDFMFKSKDCPQEGFDVILSDDGLSLTVLFDDYSVAAGGEGQKLKDYLSCRVEIPVILPPGYNVSVYRVDYRGFIFLESPKARAKFTSRLGVRYGKKVKKTPVYQAYFEGPIEEDFMASDESTVTLKTCRQDVNLVIYNTLSVKTPRKGANDALFNIDSWDTSENTLTYHLDLTRCL